ncbi:unnamed protein product [Heterobilharzia americana]|nr:unnamed protein product [Heterobilharzia americana]CAH8657934.1 unnamed protein product [Heterobilharzia americana]
MLGVLTNVLEELSAYFTDVQISFLKYAVSALLFTSTSFYFIRRTFAEKPTSVTTKKPKTRTKKGKSKSVDGRTSSSDGDHKEAKRSTVVTPHKTKQELVLASPPVETLSVVQSMPKKTAVLDGNMNDKWVAVKRGTKSPHQQMKSNSIKEPQIVVPEVSKFENKTRVAKNKAIIRLTSKRLPPVPHIPPFKSGGSESDGEWREVRPSRKGRKLNKN